MKISSTSLSIVATSENEKKHCDSPHVHGLALLPHVHGLPLLSDAPDVTAGSEQHQFHEASIYS